MKSMLRIAVVAFVVLLCASCLRINVQGDPATAAARLPEVIAGAMAKLLPLRVATYNTSLYSDDAGGLIRRLERGDAGARKIATVLQRVRPDLVLLNEFDYDDSGRAADLFQRDYLEVPQTGGGDPLRYPYRYLAPVNTGVPSGLDLDRNGAVGGSGRERGNDAWGFGMHPGQYGMLVLSRYPIDAAAVRTFRLLKWSALPGARRPMNPATGAAWYPDAIWAQLRLSSKSHWDVPVRTPQGVVHLLASHPTPPVFDGAEDRNGARNYDEIRLWAEYLTPGAKPWLCDDQGRCGSLPAGAQFVIAGDLNADPVDGDSVSGAIMQLLRHPRIDAGFVPRSPGARARAAAYRLPRKGDIASHTGDFGAKSGTLRLDYLLPSRDLAIVDGAVYWPPPGSPDTAIADGSDHHLVWLDLIGDPPR